MTSYHTVLEQWSNGSADGIVARPECLMLQQVNSGQSPFSPRTPCQAWTTWDRPLRAGGPRACYSAEGPSLNEDVLEEVKVVRRELEGKRGQ